MYGYIIQIVEDLKTFPRPSYKILRKTGVLRQRKVMEKKVNEERKLLKKGEEIQVVLKFF